jgi:hypothetical protein
VDFRTPLDIRMSDGMYQFPDTAATPQFSGLYKVLRAESSFRRGKFTQQLKLLRIRNQEVKAPATPPKLATNPAQNENANAGKAPDEVNNEVYYENDGTPSSSSTTSQMDWYE